jgi:hypothetical protein
MDRGSKHPILRLTPHAGRARFGEWPIGEGRWRPWLPARGAEPAHAAAQRDWIDPWIGRPAVRRARSSQAPSDLKSIRQRISPGGPPLSLAGLPPISRLPGRPFAAAGRSPARGIHREAAAARFCVGFRATFPHRFRSPDSGDTRELRFPRSRPAVAGLTNDVLFPCAAWTGLAHRLSRGTVLLLRRDGSLRS